MGCLGSLFAILLIVAVIYLIISHIKQILTVILYGVLAMLALVIIMGIWEVVKKKYVEKHSDGMGKMAFVQKITNFLKIKKTKKEPLDFNLPSLEELNNCSDTTNNEDDMELEEIHRKIEKVRELAKVMGTTIDREKFYCSLIESQKILLDLIQYENKYDFDPPPSKDLECLERRKKEQIDFLEYRIKEVEQGKKGKGDSGSVTETSDVDESENIILEKENENTKEKNSDKADGNEIIIDTVFEEISDSSSPWESQTELLEKRIEEKEKEFVSSIENDVKKESKPVKNKPKPQYTYMSQYDIEKYARECNAYVEREERKEQYEQRNAKNEESSEKGESTQSQYEYVLFSESINTDSIIGFRSDYMRNDYTIEPIFYESHQYLYNVWKLSNDLKKAVKAKNFFESLEEIEKALETIDKYNYPKFNPEKEKEYFYSKKDEVLIKFLNRSFTDEYRSSLELKTSKGKINRLGNWFSMIDHYKKDFNPNVLEAFECLVDKWQFEILPSILEPENKKEI